MDTRCFVHQNRCIQPEPHQIPSDPNSRERDRTPQRPPHDRSCMHACRKPDDSTSTTRSSCNLPAHRQQLNLKSAEMPSPVREMPSAAHHPLVHTDLQPPPSPRTHRALRRLQSAHTLGAKAASQASALAQQRREQRNASPTRNPAVTNARHQQVQQDGSRHRGRANSDATSPMLQQANSVAASRRSGTRKPVFSHGQMSLQQIIRDGPNDGDYVGALESARWKVIDEGVNSAEDGMVGNMMICFEAPCVC